MDSDLDFTLDDVLAITFSNCHLILQQTVVQFLRGHQYIYSLHNFYKHQNFTKKETMALEVKRFSSLSTYPSFVKKYLESREHKLFSKKQQILESKY